MSCLDCDRKPECLAVALEGVIPDCACGEGCSHPDHRRCAPRCPESDPNDASDLETYEPRRCA